MKKIGIIYIATGPYIKFWEDFYKSFQENFIPTCEKKWCVFTDAKSIYNEQSNDIYRYDIDARPWPLVTLLRFNTFLLCKDVLKDTDYVFFLNANAYCAKQVSEAEIIGDGLANLILARHPGFLNQKPINFTYDRNPRSLAYIPYNCGQVYVQGSFIGGKTEAFFALAACLNKRIEADLKNNIIALYHDESHLNRYICGRNDCKILSVEYNFPEGFQFEGCQQYSPSIIMRDKAAYFDVAGFKNSDTIDKTIRRSAVKKVLCAIYRKAQGKLWQVKRLFYLCRDTIMKKSVEIIS